MWVNCIHTDAAKCIKCAEGCAECTGIKATECTKCKKGFFDDGSKCSATCPVNKWKNENSGTPICAVCDPTCV